MADHSIRIGIDSSQAEAGSKRVSKSLQDIQQAAARLLGTKDGITVGIDGSGAAAGAARVSRSLRDILSQSKGVENIHVGLDAGGLDAEVGRVSRSLRDISGQSPRTIPVGIDTSSLDAATAKVSRTIRDINEQTGEVRLAVDASGVAAGTQRVRRSLDEIRDDAAQLTGRGGIKVGIDGAGAEAGGTRGGRALQSIREQAAKILRIPVGLDASGVQSSAASVSRSLKDIRDQAAKLSDKTIAINLDSRGLNEAVQRVSRSLHDISSQAAANPVSLKIDATSVETAASRIQRTLRGLTGQGAAVAIKIDSAAAESATRRVERSLHDLEASAAKVKIDIDSSAAEAGAARVNRSLRDIITQSAKATRIPVSLDASGVEAGASRVSKSLRDIQGEAVASSSRMELLSGSVKALGGVFAALKAADLGRDVVSTTAKFQDLETRLLTLTGSAEKTAETQKYLGETAKRMSVDIFALSDSYAKFLPLIDAGVISTEEARRTMEGLSNIAAATGANADKLKDVMYGLGQALSSPKTNAEDLNQVVEPLPGLLQKLDKAAKLPAGGFKDMVKEGRVTAAFFKETLIKALGDYEGAAERTAGNINATTTRMKNAWNELLNTIGKRAEPAIIGTLELVTLGIAGLERGVLGLIRGIEGVGNGIARIYATFKNMDWSSPVSSFNEAWEKAKADNPAPAAIPSLADVMGKSTASPSKVAGGSAKLLPKEGKSNGGGGGGKSEALREQEQLKRAYDDMLVRYSDEADALAYQSLHYGESAQEIDRLTAQYNLWNAAKQAGIQKDQAVVEQIDLVSRSYAESQQKIRDNAAAEQVRQDAISESARVLESSRTTLEQYMAGVQRLNELQEEYAKTNGEVGISQETFNRALGEMRNQLNGDAAQIFADTRTEAEQYAESLAKLQEMLQLYIETNGQLGISQDTFNRAVQQMNDSATKAMPGLDALAHSIPSVTAAFDMAARSSLLSFEDALVDIVTGAKSAREAFADMAKSIAADLARMAIRMAIIQPLAAMFGGGFGPAVAAPVFGGFMSAAQAGPITWGPQAHTGGIIGSDPLPMRALPAFHTGGVAGSETPMTRSLSSSMPPLSSWPKFHNGGLAGNEVPSILKRGEGVFTPAQMAALAPVNNNTDNSSGNVIHMPVTVNVPQSPGGDPSMAERQGKIIAKQIQQAMDEHLTKAMRPGGLLNQTGY